MRSKFSMLAAASSVLAAVVITVAWAGPGDYATMGYDSANSRDVWRVDSNGNLIPGAASTFSIGDGDHSVSSFTVSGTLTIPAASIQTAKLVAGAVDSFKILDGAVQSSKIKEGAVGTAKLADGACGTSKIVDGAINTSKLFNWTTGVGKPGNIVCIKNNGGFGICASLTGDICGACN